MSTARNLEDLSGAGVNGLQKDPLTNTQQVLLTELQQRLAALVKGTNGTSNLLVVNEPWALALPLVGQPSQ